MHQATSRAFAIVPAAGNSVRMGVDKLRLLWNGKPLIEHHVNAWLASGVDRVVVITRPSALPLIEVLRGYHTAIDLLVPEFEPEDMKRSVQIGLAHIRDCYQPHAGDAWLLAPADMPRLSGAVVRMLREAYRLESSRAIVPTVRARRGHPVLLPWSWHDRVMKLGPDEGINRLVAASRVKQLEVDEPTILGDVDTPEDYRKLIGESGGGSDLS